MATRPIFCRFDKKPFFIEKKVDFRFYPGFAIEQKRRSIESLHEAYLQENSAANILEISSKSLIPVGNDLSAFNLKYTTKSGKSATVESVFQSSKIFEKGGPYEDLLFKPSIVAKKDPRIKQSGKLIGFCLEGEVFSTKPLTFFYDWIYINALASNKQLKDEVLRYDAFTDIEFNPEKSLNCQARAAAIHVSLYASGMLDKALSSKEEFLQIVYNYDEPSASFEQLSLL